MVADGLGGSDLRARDGTTRVQFCQVQDLARVVAELVHGGIPAGVYNVGPAESVSFDELIETLASVSGLGARTVHVGDSDRPARSYFPFRNINFVTDTYKVAQRGIRFVHLADGLRASWEWYVEQQIEPVPLSPAEKELQAQQAPESE